MIKKLLRKILYRDIDDEIKAIKIDTKLTVEKKFREIDTRSRKIEDIVAYEIGKAAGGFR